MRATRATPREVNRQILLNLVREHEPISRADLARRMEIARGMVTSLVDELIADGSLYEGATVDSPRGRRPQMLFVRTRGRLVVAVDVRFSRTYVMLGDFKSAAQAYNRGLAVTEQTDGLVSPVYGNALLAMSGMWMNLGDYAEAMQSLQRACDVFMLLGEGETSSAFCLMMIGVIHKEVGDLGHEAGHATGPAPPELPKQGLTEAEYVRQDVANRMSDEGRAQLNEAKVLDEIRDNGGTDGRISGRRSDEYMDVYDDYKNNRLTQDEAEKKMGDLMKDDVTGNTGVEMEALTAVSVACLTIYDMVKAVEREMRIEGVRLIEKRGGKSGTFKAAP